MNTKKQTILELCMSPDLGGLELYMAESAKSLSNTFNVVSLINEKSKLEAYLEGEHYLKIPYKSKLFIYFSAKKIAKIIDEQSVALVHIHWTKDLPLAVLSKLLSKTKPKIVQSRHMTMTRFKDDFYHRFLYKNVDLMLAVTEQVKEQIEKFIPYRVRPKVIRLYPGAKKEQVLSLEKNKYLKQKLKFNSNSFNIGMVGRINKDKGQYLLIRAIELLREKKINVSAYFVGSAMEKSYLEELENEIIEKSLDNSIKILGFMDSINDFYQLCDLVVLASKKETFGLVIVEAMMQKCAVIGANSGGVVEIIDDKKTGLLFKSQDVQDLADKIELLVQDTQLLKELQVNGKDRAMKEFNNELQFKKLSEILQEELLCS